MAQSRYQVATQKQLFNGRSLIRAITIACSFGFLLFGYDQGVMAGLVGANNQFGQDFNHPQSGLLGTIVAIYEVGCFVGSMGIFVFGDYMGRRWCIRTGCLIGCVGAAIQAGSISVGMLIAGRIVTGLGIGALTSAIPTWQSETCLPKHRGRLLAINANTSVLGVVVAYWMDYGFAYVDGPAQWRFPVAFQIILMLLLVAMTYILPESPRYLVKQGKKEEARGVLAALEGKNVPLDDPRVLNLFAEIEKAMEMESAGGPFKYTELFTGGKLQNFRRIILCFTCGAFQQLTGINMITQYSAVIFQTIGLSRHMSLLMGGISGIEYFCAGLIPIWIIDKVSRRRLLIGGSIGCCLCMTVLAITQHDGSVTAGYVGVAMVFLFNTSLAIGWLTIPWLYGPEVCTLRLRQRGNAMASAAFWLCNFIVVEITPPGIVSLGWKFYIIFAVLNAFFVPVIYCFFPETCGITLESVDYLFEAGGFTGGVLPRQVGKAREAELRQRFPRDVEHMSSSHQLETAIESYEHTSKE